MRSRRCIPALVGLLVIGLVAASAAVGCTPKRGTAGKPAVIEAWVNVIDPTRMTPSLSLTITGSGVRFVTTGEMDLCVELGTAPDEAWFEENVRIEGAVPSRSGLYDKQVSCSFAAGPVGEKITVTITSVIPPDETGDSLVVVLERAESTTARLEREGDQAWSEVKSGDVVPDRPLRLRLGFSQAVDRATVGSALATTGLGAFSDWVSDEVVLLTLDQPPSLVEIHLREARDARGLPLAGNAAWEFYVGQPPKLCSLDPGVTLEQPVTDLMADVCAAAVSPDGRTLLVEAFKNRTGQMDVWLVDLTTGARRALRGAYYPGWVKDSSLLRFVWDTDSDTIGYEVVSPGETVLRKGALPKSLDHYSLSPDGKWLAGLVAKVAGPEAGDYVWHDLALTNLDTGDRRVFEQFVRIYAPPDVGLILGAPAWSKDCSLIAAVSDEVVGSVIRVLDLGLGQIVNEVPLAALDYGSWAFFSWSPDGRWWVAGHSIVDTTPPHPIRDLEVSGAGRPSWSPDGKWFARCEVFDGWGETKLYRIDSILGPVVERPLGQAFPCGWDGGGKFFFVRWPGQVNRFLPVWD